MPKLDNLISFVDQSPDEPLPRYALGMEYRNLGRLEDAIAAFRELQRRKPDYVPTYLMLAQTLIGLGRRDEARPVLEAGLGVARAAFDHHTVSELSEALASLGP